MKTVKKTTRQPSASGTAPFKHAPGRAELYAMGKSLRVKCPRASHAVWQAPANRLDPLSLLEASSQARIPQLIPIRYGRMLQSPFTFYRGAALNMAADLAGTPASGLRVQACGDCHLHNFGAFATPERRVIFDINDLDETLPAPWEWDVKRLAASFVLACRDNGFSKACASDAALACARSYRERMAEFSEMRTLDVWYASLDVEKDMIPALKDKDAAKRGQQRLAKARARSVLEQDFPELVTAAGGVPTIKENPPLIYHWREQGHEKVMANVRKAFARYRETLPEHRRLLLDRFKVADVAIKVVGVGSVGTLCGVMLLLASEHDPLFLQLKEARPSVLEAYAGKSPTPTMASGSWPVTISCNRPATSSLGWTQGDLGRQFYIRQLKDVKIKILVETFSPSLMSQYGEFCGWTLARAHARSGEPAKISGYLGKSDAFDKAIAAFSSAYADQSERDHAVLMQAVRKGRMKVQIERA